MKKTIYLIEHLGGDEWKLTWIDSFNDKIVQTFKSMEKLMNEVKLHLLLENGLIK